MGLVDAYYNWGDVTHIKCTTALKTVENISSMFAAFRLPEQIVTDNGPQFMYEVPVFLRYNAVQHVKTPPYHSASNGAAQRLVQTVMKNLVRQLRGRRRSGQAQTIQNRLDQFLFTYRNTLCSKTGKTPGETFLSCEPRTRLSTLHPELAKRPKPTSSQDGDKGQKKKGGGDLLQENGSR